MTVFFAGRRLITPTSASVVDDSGLANRNLSVGNNVVLVGRSEGGAPNKILRFGTPEQARSVLRRGELLDAVVKAFAPSTETGGPSEVLVVRVNPATRGTLSLKNGAAAEVISLVTTDYGLYTNQIKTKIEAGSLAGKKVTTQFAESYFSEDNVARSAFSLQYTGAQASAVMTITATSLVLQAPTGTPVATIDLNAFNTVQKLVDRINSVVDFTSTVLDGNAQKPSLNGLDFTTAVDVKTAPYIVRADLQAVVDWYNGIGEGFVTATRAANVGTLPANIGFTYLTGAVDGSVTNTEWANALAVCQQADAQWVTTLTSEASVHAMCDAHCHFMSTVGKKERRSINGTAAGTSDSAAIAVAKMLNSDRTSLVHLGYYDYDETGALVLFPPYITAAGIAGMFAGVNPGTPLTNKVFACRGLERDVRNPTDTDPLISGGVLCLENTEQGFKVVQSISTWLVNDNYNRVEVSTGVAVDFTVRNVRDALDVLRGSKGSPYLLERAKSIATSRLEALAMPEPSGPGVLVGNDESPAFRNVRASIDADVVRVDYECQPAIGVNYVLSTVYARAFTGSTAA